MAHPTGLVVQLPALHLGAHAPRTGRSTLGRTQASLCSLGLLVVMLLASCGPRGFSVARQKTIEVTSGSTTEERIQIASALVSSEGLARLRRQVKEQVPSATDVRLAFLTLRPSVRYLKSLTSGGSSTTVTVTVFLRYDGAYDPEPIMASATAIVERQASSAVPEAPSDTPPPVPQP